MTRFSRKAIKFKTIIIRKSMLALIGTALCLQAYSQQYEYTDQFLGWIKLYKFKGAAKPLQVDDKKYSIAQLSIADSFANWMQASYTPRGALGDIIKYLTPKTGMYNSDRYNRAAPHSYGARAASYIFLKKANGKWAPENNLGYHWTICANEIPLMHRLQDYETGKVSIFTLPYYTENDTGEAALYDVSKYPGISKFITHTSPKSGSIQRTNYVILSRNNVFPFVQLSIGEALQYAEEALPFKLAERISDIKGNNIGRQAEIDRLSGYAQQQFTKWKETLQLLKEKYRNRMDEPAYARFMTLSDLNNGTDIFTGSKVNEPGQPDKSMPLLRIRPEFEAGCKTDKPQWITIKWWGGAMNEDAFKHMHESIANNFNFDYVYNFFFDPQKVKGMPYRPLRSPSFSEQVPVAEKSERSISMAADPSVLLYEDFSSTPAGKMPTGWTSGLNVNGQRPVVISEEGQHWVQLKGHHFHLGKLGKTLPVDFTASFDLFVKKDFHWGSPGLECYLAGQKKYENNYANYIMVKIRPGFDEREGWATVNIKSAEKSLFPKEVAVPGFSNNKSINRITITIRKTGTRLEVKAGNTLVFSAADAVPAQFLLDHIYFTEYNQGWEEEDFYITNIKIVKE